jgi:hypothetical protein
MPCAPRIWLAKMAAIGPVMGSLSLMRPASGSCCRTTPSTPRGWPPRRGRRGSSEPDPASHAGRRSRCRRETAHRIRRERPRHRPAAPGLDEPADLALRLTLDGFTEAPPDLGRVCPTGRTDEVGADHPVTGRHQNRDHPSIQERPRRFTVQPADARHHHWRSRNTLAHKGIREDPRSVRRACAMSACRRTYRFGNGRKEGTVPFPVRPFAALQPTVN